MRPAEYQEADIIKAGQKIQKEGRTVTAFGIRNALGGGNPLRIGEIWNQYIANEKQGQTNQTEGNDATALPHALHQHCTEAKQAQAAYIDGLYLTAYTMVEKELRERYRKDFDDLKRKEAEGKIALDDAETSLENADRDKADLTTERDSLRKSIAELRTEVQAREFELKEARKALSSTQTELKTLTGTSADLERRLTEAQRLQSAAEARNGVLEKDLEKARSEAKEQRDTAEKVRTENVLLNKEMAQIKSELYKEQQTIDSLTQSLEIKEKGIFTLGTQLRESEKQIAALTATLGANEREIAALREHVATLQQWSLQPHVQEEEAGASE
jgi:chromosome segregation ATPase